MFGILNQTVLYAEAKFDTKNLLKAINTFSFIYIMFTTWYKILSAIIQVNIILQRSKIKIDMAVTHLRSLIQFFEKFRKNGTDEIFIEAERKAEMLGIVNEF